MTIGAGHADRVRQQASGEILRPLAGPPDQRFDDPQRVGLGLEPLNGLPSRLDPGQHVEPGPIDTADTVMHGVVTLVQQAERGGDRHRALAVDQGGREGFGQQPVQLVDALAVSPATGQTVGVDEPAGRVGPGRQGVEQRPEVGGLTHGCGVLGGRGGPGFGVGQHQERRQLLQLDDPGPQTVDGGRHTLESVDTDDRERRRSSAGTGGSG